MKYHSCRVRHGSPAQDQLRSLVARDFGHAGLGGNAEQAPASGQLFTNQEPRTGKLIGTPALTSAIRASSSSDLAARSWANPTRPLVPKCPLADQAVAGNSPVYSHGCKSPLPVAEEVAGNSGCRILGRILYISYSSTPRSCILTGSDHLPSSAV